jgi:plastocyanin
MKLRVILNMSCMRTTKKTAATLATAALALTMLAVSMPARASEAAAPELRFENGRFAPAALTIDAQKPVRLSVVNSGKTPIEFESFDLNRERVVAPGEKITVYLPALDKGTYKFFDDFHRDAGEGVLTAR